MFFKKSFWYDLCKNMGQSIDWLYAKNISAKKRPWYRKLLRYMWISYILSCVFSISIYGVLLENYEILKFFISFCGLSENFLDNVRSFCKYCLCSTLPISFFMIIAAGLSLFKGKRLRYDLQKELIDAWNFFMLSLCAFCFCYFSVLAFDFSALGVIAGITGIKLYYDYSDIFIFLAFVPIFCFLMSVIFRVCIYEIRGYLAYNSVYWKKYTIKTWSSYSLGLLMFGIFVISLMMINEQNSVILCVRKSIVMILFYLIFLFLWFIPTHYDAINEYRKRIIKI
jgi:hypothetical protein